MPTMEALRRIGVSEEDARDYVNIGCVELDVPGKTGGWQDACYVTLPKVLELALNNGRCLDCAYDYCPNYKTCCRGVGKSMGLETGFLKDFKTFDEVLAAYQAQLKYWADRAILTVNVLQDVHVVSGDIAGKVVEETFPHGRKTPRRVGKDLSVGGGGQTRLRYGKPPAGIGRRVGNSQNALVKALHSENTVSLSLVWIGFWSCVALKRFGKAVPKCVQGRAAAGVILLCQPYAQPQPKAMEKNLPRSYCSSPFSLQNLE